jgi:hypothetical protein
MDVETKPSEQNLSTGTSKLAELVLLQQQQLNSLQKQVKLLTEATDILETEIEELKTKV